MSNEVENDLTMNIESSSDTYSIIPSEVTKAIRERKSNQLGDD